jgi:hypothetical protein
MIRGSRRPGLYSLRDILEGLRDATDFPSPFRWPFVTDCGEKPVSEWAHASDLIRGQPPRIC